jgi:hypothetical protein
MAFPENKAQYDVKQVSQYSLYSFMLTVNIDKETNELDNLDDRLEILRSSIKSSDPIDLMDMDIENFITLNKSFDKLKIWCSSDVNSID